MVILRDHEAASSSYPSSSNTSYSSTFTYHVFLSFRGADTRSNFTDHLYAALKRAGIRTFRDDDEIPRGESLKPELEEAIKQSAVSVIVFSNGYASSTWCLDEVLAILEHRRRSGSKHQVIPVFYKVKPSDVREQKGSFAEAFYQHYEQVEAEIDHERKIKAWRAGLKEAADLSGFVLADGLHESKFIEEIVREVDKKLNRKGLIVDEHLVGIDGRVNRINSWLQDASAKADVFVIYGIGGIGKSTIAKLIYNENFHDFEVSCFIADVREGCEKPDGLLRLQRQLLSNILKKQTEEIIWNADEGTGRILDAICNKRVFIVLDDVIELDQLDALLGQRREFYLGSKIIITTRNKGLLNSLEGRCEVYPIKELDEAQSLKLFSWYAFHPYVPKKEYMELSEALIRHCAGLPLAIKVIGRSLLGQNIEVWKSTLQKLEAIPNAGVQKILQISYESLQDNMDKNLFLHIACFFVGEDKDYVVKILEPCGLHPVVGIQNLVDRCLLVVEVNTLIMHPMIKAMGREIVRQESVEEPGKRSRLWCHKDSYSVLKEKTGTGTVKGLVLDMRNSQKKEETPFKIANDVEGTENCWYEKFLDRFFNCLKWLVPFSSGHDEDFETDAFEKMDNLTLLQLNYVRLSGSSLKLPKRLRWLCWHGFPFECVAFGIPLKKLVALDMRYSKLKQVWKGSESLPSLKILNLSYSEKLIKTPNVRQLPVLESLILKGCVSLVEVCESITDLEGLVLLDLEDCKSLRIIPCLPTSLITLHMPNCLNLGAVGLVKCLASLPYVLVTLNVRGCNLSDDSFPKDMSLLFSLKNLNLSNNSIRALPGCVRSLPNIKVLDVWSCSQLQSILDLPSTVQYLNISVNDQLEKVTGVPNSILLFVHSWCDRLAAVEDCFRLCPIEKVDGKILKNLCLESISVEENQSELDGTQMVALKKGSIKVLYEYGIFSTYVSGTEFPCCFMYKERGSKISFTVPQFPSHSRIMGLNICCSLCNMLPEDVVSVEVTNRTRCLTWVYMSRSVSAFISAPEVVTQTVCGVVSVAEVVWSSLWKCGDVFKAGDEVLVQIRGGCSDNCKPKECGINLVCEDNEDERNASEEDEEKFLHSMHDHLSWTDKMPIEISNYNLSGNSYYFSNEKYANFDQYPGTQQVDWWGLKPKSTPRISSGWNREKSQWEAGAERRGLGLTWNMDSKTRDQVDLMKINFMMTSSVKALKERESL